MDKREPETMTLEVNGILFSLKCHIYSNYSRAKDTHISRIASWLYSFDSFCCPVIIVLFGHTQTHAAL